MPIPNLTRTFLTGLVAIVPIAVTLFLLVWLGMTAETMLGGALRQVLPELLYFPGLGVIISIILIFLIGLLLRVYVIQWIFSGIDAWMQRIPLVKTIYGVARDVTNLLSGDMSQQLGEAVLVTLPGTDYRLVGFVTREDFSGALATIGDEETIAVYLPMSYQIGGYTLMLPRSQVKPLDLSLEDALRYTLTAGVSVKKVSH